MGLIEIAARPHKYTRTTGLILDTNTHTHTHAAGNAHFINLRNSSSVSMIWSSSLSSSDRSINSECVRAFSNLYGWVYCEPKENAKKKQQTNKHPITCNSKKQKERKKKCHSAKRKWVDNLLFCQQI